MVKDVATYFSMTLGAFVFWQSMDEVHVRIALHQDEKVPKERVKDKDESAENPSLRDLYSNICNVYGGRLVLLVE
ncbi:hypothetical protein D8674_012953 [Pyrus ussuriensis x Pyrus communis]|uniref:Uncharacterized protein n=1 Tax=Pyrus ussuriensis x Pyrus communis TaxID=2448454 RepID=A0A5N5H1Z1_9ROSA|nr:hypothetical protein D8674_012953 [Pyrus ussuriensis x Pyrus communis]